MRSRFDSLLNRLNTELITMGALCEEAINGSVQYLFGNDGTKGAVMETEREIDRKEREIEDMCMRLLIQQQPVACDLRMISAALKMISDMERIGDQASDIAEIADCIVKSGFESETHIYEMAKTTSKMVTDSINSFVKKDADAARAVIHYDDVIDTLFVKVKKELTEAAGKSAADAEKLADLLMIAKYFERIGDHAENIAQWVIYSITGEH